MTCYDLKSRTKELKSLLKRTAQALRKMPVGRLRIKCGPPPRYYHVTSSENRCGRYIPKKDLATARALAQKAYLQTIHSAAQQELAFISKLNDTPFTPPELVYSTLSKQRKELVTPLFITDEEFAEEWINTPYEGKGFLETDSFYVTARGERVRSKSEILIANLMNELGILYRYEAPLFFDDGTVIHPDFTVLKPRSRKICYFEHCGRMDDPIYLHNFIKRENTYIQNGLIPGRDVFMSFESSSDPLNMNSMRKMLSALFIEE